MGIENVIFSSSLNLPPEYERLICCFLGFSPRNRKLLFKLVPSRPTIISLFDKGGKGIHGSCLEEVIGSLKSQGV